VNVTRAIPHPTARSQAPGPRVHPGNRVGKEKITHSKNMHTRVMMRRIRIQGLLSDCMGFDGYLIVGDERFVHALDNHRGFSGIWIVMDLDIS